MIAAFCENPAGREGEEQAMFKTILIANRGEIACRVMRTARRLGIRCIAVYSDADRAALHVAEADEAYRIGPAPAAESYLRIDAIVAAALCAKAEAIHPGYGFLSEKAEFAEACQAAGLVFIGPPAAAMRTMGLKDTAKQLIEKAGVPVVPGYHGGVEDPAFLAGKAREIGYPILVKAIAGGGGKGMRRVDDPGGLAAALETASREAIASFGDGRILIEKFIAMPATSKSRFSRMLTATPSHCLSVIALCSGDTKRSSRKHRRLESPKTCAARWVRPPFKRCARSTTAARGLWSSLRMFQTVCRRRAFTSWR